MSSEARRTSLDEFTTMLNNGELSNVQWRIYAEITNSKEPVYTNIQPLMDIIEKDINKLKNGFLPQLGRVFNK